MDEKSKENFLNGRKETMALPNWIWLIIIVLIILLIIWVLGLLTPALFWIIVIVLVILGLIFLFNRGNNSSA